MLSSFYSSSCLRNLSYESGGDVFYLNICNKSACKSKRSATLCKITPDNTELSLGDNSTINISDAGTCAFLSYHSFLL